MAIRWVFWVSPDLRPWHQRSWDLCVWLTDTRASLPSALSLPLLLMVFTERLPPWNENRSGGRDRPKWEKWADVPRTPSHPDGGQRPVCGGDEGISHRVDSADSNLAPSLVHNKPCCVRRKASSRGIYLFNPPYLETVVRLSSPGRGNRVLRIFGAAFDIIIGMALAGAGRKDRARVMPCCGRNGI